MNTHDAIRCSLGASRYLLQTYLSDIADQELLVRPVPGANHIAWQLGHLISAENQTIADLAPGKAPKLPSGFAENYTRETADSDDPARFLSKQRYLELAEEQRRALLELLETVSEKEMDRPAPESMREYAPTVGSAFLMTATHDLMHAAQFVVVRRLLKKAVVI